ncbi:hypothetical protein JCM4814A_94130 [Streptomyces phaeofaciens JCM 4814]
MLVMGSVRAGMTGFGVARWTGSPVPDDGVVACGTFERAKLPTINTAGARPARHIPSTARGMPLSPPSTRAKSTET